MRIAAGVILIVAAVLNLFASFGYMAGGGLASGAGKLGDTAIEQSIQEGTELTDEERAQFEEATGGIAAAGGLMVAFGAFLLISAGVLIAGAVFLFMNKKPTFVLVAGVIAILAEVGSILITYFGITNLIGLVGGILAIIAWNSMKKQSPAAPPPAPAA